MAVNERINMSIADKRIGERKMILKDYDHPYYCSDSNYYSNEPNLEYTTWGAFIDEFGDADIDMNLIFRWDIHLHDNGDLYMDIFMIGQRRGIFKPIRINYIPKDKGDEIEKFLMPHWNKLTELWKPLSNINMESK